jgi:hypothetical protein
MEEGPHCLLGLRITQVDVLVVQQDALLLRRGVLPKLVGSHLVRYGRQQGSMRG